MPNAETSRPEARVLNLSPGVKGDSCWCHPSPNPPAIPLPHSFPCTPHPLESLLQIEVYSHKEHLLVNHATCVFTNVRWQICTLVLSLSHSFAQLIIHSSIHSSIHPSHDSIFHYPFIRFKLLNQAQRMNSQSLRKCLSTQPTRQTSDMSRVPASHRTASG